MKKLITFILILITLSGYTQQSIGSTLEEVKEETTYKYVETSITDGFTSDGRYVYTVTGNSYEFHTFYKDNYCHMEINILRNNDNLDILKTVNDRLYNIVGENKWAGKNENGKVFIKELITLEDGRKAFVTEEVKV